MDLSISTYLVALLQDSSILAMLDVSSGTTKAIVVGHAIPATHQKLSKLIQLYRLSTISPHDINTVSYTINCRQPTEALCDSLATLVYTVINRKMSTYLGDGMYTQCSVGACIYEEENHYNTPVEIRVFSKR